MSEIEKLISRVCPDLKIESLEILGEGDFCRAFLVNKTEVFRFAKHEEARQSLGREDCLLPRIAEQIALEIPQPHACSLDGAAAESFIAYGFLPGEALTQTEYLKLGEKEREACAAEVAAFLREIHSFDLETAKKCGIERVGYAEKYARVFGGFEEKLSGVLEKKHYDFVVREIEKFLASADADSYRPVLLHGDLSPDHVLFDDGRVTSIIDFGDAAIGDAAWDFLWIYEDYGPDIFVRAVSNYGADDEKSLVERVLRFSKLEAIGWIIECYETGACDPAEAVGHLHSLALQAANINLLFDNPLDN